MSLYAVTREAGPNWTDGGIFEQPVVSEHAAFLSGLAGEGFLLFGGPLADTESGRVRALLIVDAQSEADIHRRLADDPWVPTEQIITTSIEPWKILVGAERLRAAQTVWVSDGNLGKRIRLFRDGAPADPAMVTRYIEQRREIFGVEPMCRVVGDLPLAKHEQLNFKTDNNGSWRPRNQAQAGSDDSLGTGFGDRFKVFRGGSRRLEEAVRPAEEVAVLQENCTIKR